MSAELSPDPCPPKTRTDLEWDRVLLALAERAVTPMGRKLARALPFATTRLGARAGLAESEEAVRLADRAEPLPMVEIPDIDEALGRLRIGAVLAPVELRALTKLLQSGRGLRRFLSSRKGACPALFAACSFDPTLDDVADEVAGSFEPDGTLSDRASPRLRELRGEYSAARQRMLQRLDDLMNRYSAILSDRFVTEREGRYVIPIRSDAHERFPGLVHSTSNSGATLFIEPRSVIPMGNRLKVLESEVQREEIAVYTRLTALLADVLPSVEACADSLALADIRAATAILARDLKLRFPELTDEPRLDLVRARHPLLALDLMAKGVEVVPSDLQITAGEAMVISGPNAGGKTVALKTMGLAALMVRAGLPLACGDGSTVGLFDIVLTDVGDDQSLQKNLSTFSAHVANLVRILDGTSRGALVLLDELAGGTDPREGEALAAGVLDSLCARGGAVAVTTHYEGLKALALAPAPEGVRARFVNASVGFDMERMRPTFRLAMGVPGSSSALAVARTYGMPGTVIERAERFLSREDRNFEELVKKLHDERAALELARLAADEREREAAARKARLDEEIARAKERAIAELSREAEALVTRLRRAKEDLRAAQERLRAKKPTEAELRETARALDRLAADVAVGGELEPLLVKQDGPPREPARDLRKGARVYVPRLRAEAEIVDLVDGGQVRVAAGPLKLVVARAELLAVVPPEPPPKRPVAPPRSERGTEALEVPIQTSDNTVDLRGLRTDDALSLAISFLDRSLNERRKVAFLVHGHGTGALRDAIRRELKTSPYVAHFRAGGQGEGGDGATVVWLR